MQMLASFCISLYNKSVKGKAGNGLKVNTMKIENKNDFNEFWDLLNMLENYTDTQVEYRDSLMERGADPEKIKSVEKTLVYLRDVKENITDSLYEYHIYEYHKKQKKEKEEE